jgi:hypothetical protein
VSSRPKGPASADERGETVRRQRLREDARRPLNVNLAETIALSHMLIKLAEDGKPR